MLAWRVEDLGRKDRLLAGAAAGLGQFGIGLWWVTEFHAVGYIALVLLELAYLAVVMLALPPGRWSLLAFPGAIVLAEAARGALPLGGLPLAGVALGQVSGPLGPAARIGGELVVVGAAAAVGAGLAALVRRRLVTAAALAAGGVAVAAAGVVAPGRSVVVDRPTMRVAAVQGGGRRGLRAVFTDPNAVYERHVNATGLVRPPVDLVVWPEDVVDLDQPLSGSPEEAQIGDLARTLDTTLVAGIVEDAPNNRFHNAAVAWSPEGAVVGRYEKVHRVPFGEYIPLRSVIERLADVGAVPDDAIAGRGPGLLRTPAGRLGVVISFEVFFPARARAATRAGGEVLLVPTNASSFKGSQVPTQEVAAAQLRAMETGRDVVQSAPTGYGAVIDSNGRVRARTTLGRQDVLHATVHRRHGLTPYMRFGDLPVIALAVVLVAAGWALQRGDDRTARAGPNRRT